jgi:superfamily II DNA or RNA helicase
MNSFQIPKQLNAALWDHQRAAIGFAVNRLRGSHPRKAVLLRMPTGTGKTGVIAVLSVAIPQPGWSLVLTPWKNLCDQLVQDVGARFWASRKWTPTVKPRVERLYPKTLAQILKRTESDWILVATFATLVAIFKKQKQLYSELAGRLSQVFVDEGHYEPAVEWGQAVKQLKRPTLLLTATPYRNDLKLFRVAKNDVYNFTHKEAVARHIIREVTFRSLHEPEPSDRGLTRWCEQFVNFWRSAERKNLHDDARAIVCCSKMSTVERVARILRDHNLDALGIHEGFAGRRSKWLVAETPDPRKVNFKVWVHQNKLTEGLDDNRFCVLAILNRIRNDRKLIQQIGRVLRTSSRKREKAIVLHSEGIPVERSWKNYLEFEVQTNLVDPERYREFLNTLLTQQPEMEYFGKRFRRKFDARSAALPSEILLRASCIVRKPGSKFDWDEFTDFTSDYLLLEDCILLGPDGGPVAGPGNSRLWVYAIFGNTPLLIEHSQYEVRLGAAAAVCHKDLFFMVDTEGLYPSDYLSQYTRKVVPNELARIFGKNTTTPKEVSLQNPWPAGPAVKSSTIHADNLADTPAQLSDAVFVCSTVRANIRPDGPGAVRRHYAGFQRGRLSEELRSTEKSAFSLNEYVHWTKELSQRLYAAHREPPEFFSRYLSPTVAPSPIAPKYLVLNVFGSDFELEDMEGNAIEFVDSIVAVTDKPNAPKADLRWGFRINYRDLAVPDRPPKEAMGTLSYDPVVARFRIQGGSLNSEILVLEEGADEGNGLVTYLNNHDELFTVALEQPEVFYTAQSFYRLDYSHAEARLATMLTPVHALAAVTSEKGKVGKRKTSWDASSIFHMIDSLGNAGLVHRNFGTPELLLCDDLGTESADFVCANFSKRKIAFIHAKDGEDHSVSASALHVIVAQAQKNLSLISRGGSVPMHLERWDRKSKWSKTNIRRWRLGAKSLPTKRDLWNRIRSEILDHPDGKKEVWLVLGRTLDKTALLDQLQTPGHRSAITGQVVHLLSLLQANCAQLGVVLRVFCQ